MKKTGKALIVPALIAGLTLVLLPGSAGAAVSLDFEYDEVVSINNTNNASVSNVITVTGVTGENLIEGGDGGEGTGGEATSEGGDAEGGDGEGGWAGDNEIRTGDMITDVIIENEVNDSQTEVEMSEMDWDFDDLCDCFEDAHGDDDDDDRDRDNELEFEFNRRVEVNNDNDAEIDNVAVVDGATGNNEITGGEGGVGTGGDADSNGDEGFNDAEAGDGTGGDGGDNEIMTGDVDTIVEVVNVSNRHITRVRR